MLRGNHPVRAAVEPAQDTFPTRQDAVPVPDGLRTIPLLHRILPQARCTPRPRGPVRHESRTDALQPDDPGRSDLAARDCLQEQEEERELRGSRFGVRAYKERLGRFAVIQFETYSLIVFPRHP